MKGGWYHQTQKKSASEGTHQLSVIPDEIPGQKFERIWQVKFVFVDMHGNLKVMLKWHVKNKHVLDFKTENNVMETLSVLMMMLMSKSEFYY